MTASKTKDIQGAGILLAEHWKLFPTDARNWELCELTDRGWMHRGRFYQYNTIDEAMLYVIDQLAKDGARDEMLALASAMEQWREGVESVREAARAWAR